MARHHLNSEFAWHKPEGPFRRITAAQARDYDELGYFLLEDAVDTETRRNLIDATDPREHQLETFLRTQPQGRVFIARADEITFTIHLVTQDAVFREFCASGLFQDLCSDLIGPDARLYWDQAVYKKPQTASPFPWHQDNGYTYIEPQQYLTCWVALTDATEANGCPWVVPGLHKLGTLEHHETESGFVCFDDAPEGARPVEARAGDVVVFSSLTPHTTGPNTTDATRKAYIVQFAPDGAALVVENDDGSTTKTGAEDPDRQFRVVVDGEKPQPGS